MRLSLLSLLSTHAAAALVMALLLYSFYRHYRKVYLQHWILAWISLAVFHVAAIASTELQNPATLLLTALLGVTALLQAVYLGFGIYELARQRRVRGRRARWAFAGTIALGIACAIPAYLLPPDGPVRDFLFIGIRAALVGGVTFVGGAAVWFMRARGAGIGFRLFSVGLLTYGGIQLGSVIFAFTRIAAGTFATDVVYIGIFDLFSLAIIGLAMVIALLDDEREAAMFAAMQIEQLAYFDPLTGLPNRSLFFDRLIVTIAQAAREKIRSAVFFLDLDRFKTVNDSLGHSYGDALLKLVAKRIREILRQGDTLARFGGDEFTVLIHRVDDLEDVARVARKIIEAVKSPFVIHGREVVISTSIGVSLYPDDGGDAETLVKNADTAMYRAKEHGRDNFQLFTNSMTSSTLVRFELENRIWKALELGELELVYQPELDIRTNKVIGCEALLRWDHPELGLLLPEDFISTAEVSGAIFPIGVWVLDSACQEVRRWHENGYRDLTVAVNLSVRQLQQEDIVEQVRTAITKAGIEPRFLELEVTETGAIQNADSGRRALHNLKALGVRISIDDFGTGYSSLSYLRRFPVDSLKLDRSFVDDVTNSENAAIVTAVLAMAQSLGMKIVAEGVERDDQLGFLRKHNCDRIQGFLITEPLRSPELDRFFASSPSVNRWVGGNPERTTAPTEPGDLVN
ncbi:MAG: putative bifunctional diguanylate cyclase/phosphodiesterase [Thermoanaerobaculia bacterium]